MSGVQGYWFGLEMLKNAFIVIENHFNGSFLAHVKTSATRQIAPRFISNTLEAHPDTLL